MKKDLRYYLKLKYKIELTPIPEEEGGGYEATIPQLGRYAFVGRGKTQIEALNKLKMIKKHYFQDYLAKKLIIHEPEKEEEYSGKFLVRLPKRLHKELVELASKNEVSLNQYIVYLLSSNIQLDSIRKDLKELSERHERQMQTPILVAEEQSGREEIWNVFSEDANLGFGVISKLEPKQKDKFDTVESELAH